MEFRKMRRNKQELSKEEAIKILEKGTSGVLALSGDENYPYAVPLSFVYTDGKLIFHSAAQGHKIDAICRNEKASFCVIDRDDVRGEEYTTYYKSVIAFGKIRIAEDEEEKKQLLYLLCEKYCPGCTKENEDKAENGCARTNIFVLEIEHITGKQARELTKEYRLS